MRRRDFWALALGGPVVVALGWALLTPAGVPGAIAGVCIISGAILVAIGLGTAGGMDTALDNLHPGANIERLSRQALGDEAQHARPPRRWLGTKRIVGGIAYMAAGIAAWTLR